jgi:hypothetical protein
MTVQNSPKSFMWKHSQEEHQQSELHQARSEQIEHLADVEQLQRGRDVVEWYHPHILTKTMFPEEAIYNRQRRPRAPSHDNHSIIPPKQITLVRLSGHDPDDDEDERDKGEYWAGRHDLKRSVTDGCLADIGGDLLGSLNESAV